MQTGVLTVGSLTLNETNIIQDSADNSGARVIQITGRETSCEIPTIPLLKDNIMSLIGRLMPVQFQYKTSYNGYYVVSNVSIEFEKWYQGSMLIGWSMSLNLVGPDNAVDIESRLANVIRSNNFGLVGERWHAPPIGHYGYYVGAVAPASVTRQSEAGAITVYRSIPTAINPRWGAPVGSFLAGRVRFLDNGTERIGVRDLIPTIGWELNNSLVRVRPAAAGTTTLNVGFYDGTTWIARDWDLRIAGDSLVPATHFKSVEVTRADPEAVAIRIVAIQPSNTVLRVIVDLLLRRGSRFVEGYIQRVVSGLVEVTPDVNAEMTMQTGYTVAPADDTRVRVATGTSKTFIQDANGGLEITSTTAMDFWIGAEVLNASAGGSNPGFETGTVSPWFGTNGTVTVRSDTPKHGTYYGRVTATAGGSDLRIDHSETATLGSAGKQYTISGWLRSPTTITAGQAFVTLHWYNGATYMSSSGFAAPALPANTWVAVSGTGTAPANTTNIGRQASILAGSVSAGTILDVDSLNVREATDSGDTAATLMQQYIGVMAEKTGAARR